MFFKGLARININTGFAEYNNSARNCRLKKQHGDAGKQAGDKRKIRQAYAAVFLGRQKHTRRV